MSQIIDNIKYSDGLKTVEGVEDKSITTAVIKEGVTAIDRFAFTSCENMESIVIPDGITSIGECAFCFCKKLEKIVIPEGVTSIGEEAFSYCRSLKTITIPNSVTEVEAKAFEECTSLEEVIYLGSEKEWCKIKFKRSKDKAELKKLIKQFIIQEAKDTKIKEIQTVSIEAFMNNLKDSYPTFNFQILNMTKTNQVLFIMGGKNATVVQLNANVSSWSENFQKFLSVFCDETKTNDEINEAFVTNKIKIAEIKRTFSKPKIEVDEMNLFIDELPEMKGEREWQVNTTSFFCNAKIKKLTFARNTVIDWCTFSLNKSFENVVLPENISSIGKEAFSYCTALQNVIIPEGVSSIADHMFCFCENLENVVIPENVTSIEAGAFASCDKLKNIVIPEGITSIGTQAFFGCKKLESIIIPKGVTTIERGLFRGCEQLQSLVIPEGATSIGAEAFQECKKLQNFVIPNGITTIERWTFKDCTSLQSVTIPESVTFIDWEAFSGCENLKKIVIPHSVIEIRKGAFKDCKNLALTYDGTKEEWEKIDIDGPKPENVTFSK